MPWRGPEVPGEFPTLGYQVCEWIEAHCVIPDGEHLAEPFMLTDEMVNWFLWFYRLREDAKFLPDRPAAAWTYRRGQLVRPQKWGKGPLAAAQICAEAAGPVLFAGWDADGEPVGRPWATPWIQVTAAAEDQTDNIWRALMPMIQLGPLTELIPDVGIQRINLPGGGFVEPVSASALSRLGQRLTFDVHDETQNWFATNRGHWLADTKRRNLAGMGGRSIETTNAWDPAEGSVAQRTHEAKSSDIYRDNRQPGPVDTTDMAKRRECMRFVYGDSWWVDLDRIDAEWQELAEYDQAQADRFFCNVIGIGSGVAFNITRWHALAKSFVVPPKSLITVGFDGSKFDDATALVATHVESGYQWPLGIWYAEDHGGEIPEPDVTATLEEAFDTWKVWRIYCDPPRWEDTIDRWAGKWGEKRVVKWWTNRPRQMAFAIQSYLTAINSDEGGLSHSGHAKFAEHIANARKAPSTIKDENGLPLFLIRKEYPKSPLKIDAAMAGILSWVARGDAVSAGALRTRSRTLQLS